MRCNRAREVVARAASYKQPRPFARKMPQHFGESIVLPELCPRLYPGVRLREDFRQRLLACNIRSGPPHARIRLFLVQDSWLVFFHSAALVPFGCSSFAERRRPCSEEQRGDRLPCKLFIESFECRHFPRIVPASQGKTSLLQPCSHQGSCPKTQMVSKSRPSDLSFRTGKFNFHNRCLLVKVLTLFRQRPSRQWSLIK